MQREPLYQALYDRLKNNLSGVVTFSRTLEHFAAVPRESMPAVYLTVGSQRPEYSIGRRTLWTLGAQVYLYAANSGDKSPGQIINELIDQMAPLFAPDNAMGNTYTLGGLAHRVAIDDIETDEGNLQDKSIAIVSITIEAYGNPF